MIKSKSKNINVLAGSRSKILVVTDAIPQSVYGKGEVMSAPAYRMFLKEADRNGFGEEDFVFITPCPPIPIELEGSESKINAFVSEYRAEFLEVLKDNVEGCKAVIALGKVGNRQLMGKPVQVTKARGTFCLAQDTGSRPVLPLLSPFHVLRRPELKDIYDSDFRQLAAIKKAGWVLDTYAEAKGTTGYRWSYGIKNLLDNSPKGISLDCETVGLDWHSKDFRILTIAITPEEGVSYVVPVDVAYATNKDLHGVRTPDWMKVLTQEEVDGFLDQIKELLRNSKVSVCGHNLKYDIHALSSIGVSVENWYADTMQLAFAVDENMTSKSLDDCARRWVPTHAGYADCVAPETEILMADMSYKTAGELKSGDELCAFTKDTKGKKAQRREMGVSVVRRTQRIERPCLKITTASGRSIIVSVGHLFLSKRAEYERGGGWRWRRADELKVGSVLKPFPWEKQKADYDSGWVSGIIDGEGWLCKGVSRMGVSQKPNSVLDRFRKLVEMNGIKIGHSTDKRKKVPCVNLTFDSSECFKMLQRYRPMRLIESRKWVGCGLPTNGMKHDVIVSIEDVGVREVVGLSTSTQTIISNGLLSHNSFNKKTDKSRMDLVKHDEMLEYAGGDTDVTFRLMKVLLPLAKEDERNFNCFTKIQMPALRTFVAMERDGVRIDTEALKSLGDALKERSEQLYKEILDEVPVKVLKQFEGDWNLGSAKFLVACLFGPDGIIDPSTGKRLKPVKFTESTQKLPPEERVPSVSIKDHLPYFEHIAFVRKLIEYSKMQKVRSTYVGSPESTIVTPVKRTATGSYPKAIQEALASASIVLPKNKSVRSRIKVLQKPATIVVGSKSLVVDEYGSVSKVEKKEAAGFWQHIDGSGNNLIHTSFLLHATNTGRTSCLRADSIVTTSLGDKRIDEVKIGDLVWTHKNRWRSVSCLFQKPKEQMFTVEFNNGSILHCTLGHKLLTDCGKWVSLLDVCIKETLEERAAVSGGCGEVQNDSFDYQTVGKESENNVPHGTSNLGGKDVCGGVQETQVSEILSFKEWKSKSDDWEVSGESPQLQRTVFRWSRILNSNCGSKTIFRSSSRNGKCNRCSPIEIESSAHSSHRREQDEQLDRQPCANDCLCSSSLPRKVCEEPSGVTIKRIEPCGSHTVYDFEVEEDHSYEAAGCFSHNSRNPNLQNTPKRGDMAKSFRKIFLPPIDGWKFLELDYSQVELRVAAWMAREQNMIKIYKDGGDIHSSTAAAVTSIPLKDFLKYRKDTSLLTEIQGRYPSVDKYIEGLSKEKKKKTTIKEYFDLLRYQAKAVNFGYLYGMWWKGFKVYAKTDYGIDYTDEEAEATRVRFFKNYPALERWHRSMKNMAKEKGYVRALHGSLRRLPNVDSFDDSIIGGAERQAINAPVQRFASDLGLIAVSRLFRDAPQDKIRPVLFIHDAIVPCVAPDYVEEAASAIKYYMENPPLKSWFGIEPPFPLSADVSVGPNLGEMEEMEGVVARKPDWFRSGEGCPEDSQESLDSWETKKKRSIIITD